MLIVLRTLNNITTHRLITAGHEVLLDHYRHETTNDFEKLLDQEDAKNISKVATPILLTIGLHIGPTRLLEVGPPNAVYDLEERLHEGCTGADWGDEGEIEEAMTADNDEDDDAKDPQDKTR